MFVNKIEPGPGQESVWDYPRPPRLEEFSKAIKVVTCGEAIAETNRAKRVLETSHPPVYYIPPEDIRLEVLVATHKQSFCEWKGSAYYFDVVIGEQRIQEAAWAYPSPTGNFEPIRDYLAFYPHLMDACFVDGERVRAQAGGFYGGWVTSDIVGPFKGEPGTMGW
jgi:uncharacterized protein (DUF427 family)